MAKKGGKSASGAMSAKDMQAILIENFAGLQKAMTNLSISFSSLSDQISRLLQVFESSAKYYMQGGLGDTERELLKKLDTLAQQDKVIAHGLVSLEEMMRNKIKTVEAEEKEAKAAAKPKPLPQIGE